MNLIQYAKGCALLPLLLTVFHPINAMTTPTPTDIHELNRALGRGINLGNVFEAPTEDAWGNPWNPQFLQIIADLGFSHVRIPVRWETPKRSLADPPYTIDAAFLDRIRGVVEQALALGLRVMLNMHHHNELYADPHGQKDRFLAQWEQLAAAFAGYPDTLYLEILNEPHQNLTAELWNEFAAEALAIIRRHHPDRAIVIGTAEWGGLGGLPKLVLPEDDRLILTIHYYNPFRFTHQGASWVGDGTSSREWLGTEWLDTEEERDAVRRDFAPLLEFSQTHDIPVHIGEFGAYSTADLDSRVRWTGFLSRYFEELGFSWAYWEFSAGFGIYDRTAGQVRQPLVDALLHREMPPAAYAGDS